MTALDRAAQPGVGHGLLPGPHLCPEDFGKPTLLSEWVASHDIATAWLSLDTADNDPHRFLTYLAAALQTIDPGIGTGVMDELEAPGVALGQPLIPIDSVLTILIND